MSDRSFDNRPAISRRHLLQAIGASGLVAAASHRGALAQTAFTPEMFGARGDGRSDDYEAFHRLAAAVNRAGGGTVRFGRGRHYLLDRYQITQGPNANGIRHITFSDCRGLILDLNGSTIAVKGDFHRGVDEGRVSYSRGLIPLRFVRCSDVTVRNGILNGNVQSMTRDPRVWEAAGYGILLLGCRSVLLEGLHVHHFSTDGIGLSLDLQGNGGACEDVTLNQLRLTNNARQGFTNAGGSRVVATECLFADTGRTGGAYAAHAPGAGVDIEPIRTLPVRSDFRALRCRFDNNVGAPVLSGNPDRAGRIELIDCSGRTPRFKRMLLTCAEAVVRGGSWHNIQIACAYGAWGRYRTPITADVSGGEWSGDDPRWFPVYDVGPRRPHVRLHRNRFRLISPEPFQPGQMFLCANPNHRFEENEIFVSRTGHDGSGNRLIGMFRGAAVVAGNRWSTDAAAPLRFVNNYQDVQRLEGETFSGSFGAIGRAAGGN